MTIVPQLFHGRTTLLNLQE